MPWYPGSDDRYVSGFFDGTHWVALLTRDRLMLKDCWFALDDIAAVSYWSRRIRRRSPQWSYQKWGFVITDRYGRTGTHEFTTGFESGNAVAMIDLWQGLADISRNVIEPLLARRLCAWLAAGNHLDFVGYNGYLRLLAAGFTTRGLMRTEFHDWSALYGAEVNPFYDNVWALSRNGQVRIWVRRPGDRRPRPATAVETTVPNAVVLGALMPLCAAAFGAPGDYAL